MNDYTTCRELKPYLEPTKAMRLGAPGKFGSLDLVFELDKDKKSVMRHWDRRAPLIVQQELYFDEGMPEMPCVYILSSGGRMWMGTAMKTVLPSVRMLMPIYLPVQQRKLPRWYIIFQD